MKTFIYFENDLHCWWCGKTTKITKEHKYKKTDLELLYGKNYPKGERVSNTKFKTYGKGQLLQSSNSKIAKFQKNICADCNGSKSQPFDKSYQELIQYYYRNRNRIKDQRSISLIEIFGSNWKESMLNVQRYIGKHIGCRLAEKKIKFEDDNLIAFLNGESSNKNLKITFQIKPYYFGSAEDPIDFIYLGPMNPIINKREYQHEYITSYSGWYTIANFCWNYVYEENVNSDSEITEVIQIELNEYNDPNILDFTINSETTESDVAVALEKLENYPFKGENWEYDHYLHIKNKET